jgi:hypothetical protein
MSHSYCTCHPYKSSEQNSQGTGFRKVEAKNGMCTDCSHYVFSSRVDVKPEKVYVYLAELYLEKKWFIYKGKEL